ncbi:hypothetical protein CWO91_23815 [Bradyrhizobium genosp. SA-3]|nr:hypothetical protein CWO91_23815 [Bradyrhizobium genosp. SA-3]
MLFASPRACPAEALAKADAGEVSASPSRRFEISRHPHRHCERSEAIQSLPAVAVWIASLRSQ